MGKASDALSLVARFLRRVSWLLPLGLIGAGAALTALERWRPELVEPRRRQAAAQMNRLLDPVREGSLRLRESGQRAEKVWKEQKDTDSLRLRLMKSEAELQSTREELRRLGRVSGLSQWASSTELEFVPADVVGYVTEDQSSVITINRGREDRLREGLPVVGQRGLAGVIRELSDHSARVQTLLDPLGSVGVANLLTRHRGVVFGRGRDADPEFIPENEVQPMTPGTLLITSGFGNSVYPKGLIVGRIKEKRTDKRGLVYGVIEPAENINALEEVLVIRAAPSVSFGNDSTTQDALGAFTVQMTSTTLEKRAAPVGMTPAASPTPAASSTPSPSPSPSPKGKSGGAKHSEKSAEKSGGKGE